jgi:hypothetical protein
MQKGLLRGDGGRLSQEIGIDAQELRIVRPVDQPTFQQPLFARQFVLEPSE